MHPRRKAMIFAAAILFEAPAAAQVAVNRGRPRKAQPSRTIRTIWNVLGLFGLAGAFGLWRPSDNDGAPTTPFDPFLQALPCEHLSVMIAVASTAAAPAAAQNNRR